MEKKEIKKELKELLSKDRYKHTVGVRYTAMCLGMKYEVDLDLCEMAGLLHDCGKAMSDKEKIEVCKKADIPISEAENKNPSLLHAKIGAYYALYKYDIDNPYIIDAIRYHTTGRPNMSLLEKIIFVADYIEPGRNMAPNLGVIRKIAFEDLDVAVFLICRDTIDYVNERGLYLDEMTVKTMEFYKELCKYRLVL